MVDEPENLVLMFLRRLDLKIDGLVETMREVKQRLTAVELGLTAVRREVAGLAEADAHLSARIDKMSDRFAQIERRLDILPAV